MKTLTFIGYLIEMTDRGDHELQRDAISRQRQIEKTKANSMAVKQGNADFKNNMDASRGPARGDLVIIGRHKFVVTQLSVKGYNIQQLGGDQQGLLKHGTKFNDAGKSNSGKSMFSVGPAKTQQPQQPQRQSTSIS